MITGILHTAFWVGCVLLVALCAGAFWLLANALIDHVLDWWMRKTNAKSVGALPTDGRALAGKYPRAVRNEVRS